VTRTYPNLGFQPGCPGCPTKSRRWAARVSAAVDSLAQAKRACSGGCATAMTRVWQGRGPATAFRQQLQRHPWPPISRPRATPRWDKAVGGHQGLAYRSGELQGPRPQQGSTRRPPTRKRQLQAGPGRTGHRPQANPGPQGWPASSLTTRLPLQRAAIPVGPRPSSAVRTRGHQGRERPGPVGLDHEAGRRTWRGSTTRWPAAPPTSSNTPPDRLAAAQAWILQPVGSPAFTHAAGAPWVTGSRDHLDVIHSVCCPTISAIAGLVAPAHGRPPDSTAIALWGLVSVVAGAGALAIRRRQSGVSGTASVNSFRDTSTSSPLGAGDDRSHRTCSSVVPRRRRPPRRRLKGRRGVRSRVGRGAALPKIVDIASTVAPQPRHPGQTDFQDSRRLGTALEATKLIEQGAGAYTMVTAEHGEHPLGRARAWLATSTTT